MKVLRQYLLALSAIAALALTVAVAAAIVAALRLPEPASAGREATRSETIALAGATSARVDVELGSGTLRLAGGSLAGAGEPMQPGELLRAEFSYIEDFAPRIAYELDGEAGHLRLEQAGGHRFIWPWDDDHNEWHLFLNPTVPTDLSVEVGAGDSELALGGLTLTGLEVVTGAGHATIDFAGDWRSDLDGAVASGAGDLKLRLPHQVGVRLQVHHGAGNLDTDGFADADGAYVNPAYGTATVTIDLRIDHGAGDIELELV